MPPSPSPILIHSVPSSSPLSQSSTIQLYQHLPSLSSLSSTPTNVLLFVGGLGDGPLTIPYTTSLSSSPVFPQTYTLFEARLSSAYSAFGYASLKQDAAEIHSCIQYLHRKLEVQKIVLMGHSTGCQDALEYVLSHREDEVQGVILQGPVSDREAILMSCTAAQQELESSLKVAKEMLERGEGEEVMRRKDLPEAWRGSPVTAYRWNSLASVGGDDDYFSSDFTPSQLSQIWGRLQQPVLILPSEKDEWLSNDIKMDMLLEKWKTFCLEGIASDLSGLIPGANHRVEKTDEENGDNEGERWLVERVSRFLESV
ncbi:hypothetical protein QBC43DRAFT_307803 [Cladorrhinum sp. PSN259]|nr:hypothetical protein QBC43DRAFT_307803 [Cladorrhinum sp. PSN259]